MKSLILAAMLVAATPIALQAEQETKIEQKAYNVIHADTLKKWYDEKKAMTVIDARSKKPIDKVLPSAKWVPFSASEKEIQAAIPSKDSLLVVYCWSEECPASQNLVDRLVAMGYKNVYKFPEGLDGWLKKNYPVESYKA